MQAAPFHRHTQTQAQGGDRVGPRAFPRWKPRGGHDRTQPEEKRTAYEQRRQVKAVDAHEQVQRADDPGDFASQEEARQQGSAHDA